MSSLKEFQMTRVSADQDLDDVKSSEESITPFDTGNADSDAYFVTEIGDILACTKPWTGWYRKNGSVWKICKDSDGYRVRKPGGGTDSWGRGYSWSDVKGAYGLSGVKAYKSTCGPACF